MQFHAKYPLFDSQSERDFTFLAMRFHAKYPLFDSQSDREFTFSYAILWNTYILLDVLLCSMAEYFYELCGILTSP